MKPLYNPSTPNIYPQTVANFRATFPNLAVGHDPRDEDLSPYGWRVVTPTDPPVISEGQQLVELPPVETNGQWVQSWQVVDMPPPPPSADWFAFAGWLYQFPPIATAMVAARAAVDVQGEPATTGLPVALQEARLAQNYPAWQATWSQFLLASHMPEASVQAIVQKAVECNLPADFIETLEP